MSKSGTNPIRIVSRIYLPEPAAASFRLEGVVKACIQAGVPVEILTANPPAGLKSEDENRRYRIRRLPVLRDKEGYVRGYVQYLSFDLPAFLTQLFSRKPVVSLIEPPPTTGFFARLASFALHTPYVYFAPDLWSQAAETFTPGLVVRALRWVESFAMRGAKTVIAINNDVAVRARAMGAKQVVVVANGVDTEDFHDGPGTPEDETEVAALRANLVGEAPYFVYAGNASEVHGADIFIEAYREFLDRVAHSGQINAKASTANGATEHRSTAQISPIEETALPHLMFIGRGSKWDELKQLSQDRGVSKYVHFLNSIPPAKLSIWLRDSVAGIASLKPGLGYDFAYPTKILSALACGVPVIYTGLGPARDEVQAAELGWVCDYDASQVADLYQAVLEPTRAGKQAERERIRQWTIDHRSLAASGRQVVRVLQEAARA